MEGKRSLDRNEKTRTSGLNATIKTRIGLDEKKGRLDGIVGGVSLGIDLSEKKKKDGRRQGRQENGLVLVGDQG